ANSREWRARRSGWSGGRGSAVFPKWNCLPSLGCKTLHQRIRERVHVHPAPPCHHPRNHARSGQEVNVIPTGNDGMMRKVNAPKPVFRVIREVIFGLAAGSRSLSRLNFRENGGGVDTSPMPARL